MARVDAISGDAQAAVVLTVQDVIERSESLLDDDAAHLKEIPWLATDQVSDSAANSWSAIDLADDTLAVLQYTSGSTGQPKGVMLTHANLMHNCSIITHGFEADQQSVGISWLPTYHDMGLVGGILNPLFIGRPNVFMAPMSFLQKPIRWLRNIDRFKVTISGGPNFAYALCNEKITESDCEGLDLSSWKVAFNGAEPIRADTLERFVEKFSPYGFRAEALYPCYGMAESTLIVSGAECPQPPTVCAFDTNALESNTVIPVAQEDELSRKLVSSGRVLPDQTVLIVDSETCLPSSAGSVGEIWVQSASVAQGYWNNEQESARAFEGTLACNDDDSESDGGSQNDRKGKIAGDQFLRTGDLGFFHEGELFVIGRSKDLIIVNGRNLYPHDIEAIVETSHEAIRVGGGAAFSIDGENSEQLVIVQELVREYRKYDTGEITAAIRKAVFEFLDVAPHAIVLLKIGKLPKTSSGKIQRRACRENFLSGQLDMLAQWQPGNETIAGRSNEDAPSTVPEAAGLDMRSPDAIQTWMRERIAKQLKMAPAAIDPDEEFAYFGLDSLTLVGISGELENWLSCSVSPKLLFNYPTINELSTFLATASGKHRANSSTTDFLEPKEPTATIAPFDDEPREAKPEKSVREILANLDDLSEAETLKMLKQLLEEKAQREISTCELSYGQRALWFIHQMDRTSAAYNILYGCRVRADLDREAFCRAFAKILKRHEVLRTIYATVDGMPVQQVHPFEEFNLQVVDARSWSQEELDAETQSLANVPFDLESGPVIRVHLLERGEGGHVMLVVVHHIALDFWSLDLLIDELELFYREETTGQPATIPATKATYHDFVQWQSHALHDDEAERWWNYWQENLGGSLPVLDLPTDYPRPRLQSFRGKSHSIALPEKLTRRLIELSKSERVTLFATFLAAFQVMLYR
jgi:acyl-CoA synthetase (AMP-forming)/AMP-acid ligase II/acyl carrier protein